MSADAWPWVPLGDIADAGPGEIRTGPFGSQLHQSDYVQNREGIAVVMPKDMSGGYIDYASIARVSPEKAQRLSEHVTRSGDVLLARRGDIGRCVLVREEDAGALCGTGCIRVSVQGSAIRPNFLHRYLSTREAAAILEGMSVGATIANLNASIVRSLPVPVPPLVTQRRIASILSAYDDLIENNTRRIQILEEMAQAIYREWFVEFRFPGHEGVRMVGSELGPIPEGWSVRPLARVADVVMGQSPPSNFYNNSGDGLPFHQGVTNFGRHFPTHRTFSTGGDRRALAGDILFSVRAPVGRINLADRELILGRGVCGIRESSGAAPFLLFQLKHMFRTEDIIGSGAIFNAVKRRDVEEIAVLWPEPEIVDGFQRFALPALELIRNLTLSLCVLRETRDLLLPRLISGEIDVSDLDIGDAEPAA